MTAAYSEPALAYFASHGINPDVARSVGVTEEKSYLLFPYTAEDGSSFARRRDLAVARKAKVKQPRGQPLELWWLLGRPICPGPVLVCEGEGDALAALSALTWGADGPPGEQLASFSVCCMPGLGFGASRMAAALADAGAEEVFLALDADDEGRRFMPRAAEDLAARGLRPVPIQLPDGTDLADVLAGESNPGGWLATAVADAEAAAEGGIVAVEQQNPQRPTGKLRHLDVARMIAENPPAVPWVIEGLAAQGMLTLVVGRPGEGKSLLSMALAAGVSNDEDTAGFSCRRGKVAIVDAENGDYEIHRRVRTLGLPGDVTVCTTEGLDLRRDLGEIEQLLTVERPDVLILDSFRSLWGGEENDSGEVATVLDKLRNLARRYGTATILLHHANKNGAIYRGSSAIAASVEMAFTLARAQDDPDRARRYLECWKCRPAPEPPRRWFRLTVERGMVCVDETEPHEPTEGEGEDTDRRRTAPVRDELAPRVLAALESGPKPLKDIAAQLGRSAKDRTLRRVLDALAHEGEVERQAGLWSRVSRCHGGAALSARTPDTVTPPVIEEAA